MKVMIVDDEPIFIMGIRRLIEEYNAVSPARITVVAEAYDGMHALDILPDTTPDIVFTDIRMATVDGLELAQKIQEAWPGMRVVVVSGYPSFENARQALKVNVVDFIQKPIDPAVFNALLRKLNRDYVHASLKSLFDQLLAELHGRRFSVHLEELHQSMSASLGNVTLSLFYVRAGALNRSRRREPEAEVRYRTQLELLEQAGGSGAHAWAFDMIGVPETLFVLASGSLPEAVVHDAMAGLISAWPTSTCVQIGYRSNISFGQMNEIRQLHSNFHRLVELDASSIVRLSGKLYKEQKNYTSIGSVQESKIGALLASRNRGELMKFVSRFLQVWQHEKSSIYSLQTNLKKLTAILFKSENSFDESLLEFQTVVDRLVLSSFDYEALRTGVSTLIESELQPQEHTVNREVVYSRIRDYLSDHLNEPLTLGFLGQTFGVSISYLCAVFKEHANATFVEFLTESRLEKAADLLRSTSLSVKEVAESTGYADQRYFSKVFRTRFGCSPSEFKQQLGNR